MGQLLSKDSWAREWKHATRSATAAAGKRSCNAVSTWQNRRAMLTGNSRKGRGEIRWTASPGRHRLPNSETYDVETNVSGTTFIATIHAPAHPFIRVYVVLEAEGLFLAISRMSAVSRVIEANTAGRCSWCRNPGWEDTPVVHPCSRHRFASPVCMCST